MRAKRLLFFGINYYPELTGIGKYTSEMCEWLSAKGHKIEVITAMPFYPQWKIFEEYRGKGYIKEIINGVKVYRVPIYVPKTITGKTRIIHELSFNFSSLRFWLPAMIEKYDIVVGICPPLQVGLYPYFYKIIRKKPFIFHIQDLQVDAAKQLGLIKNKILLSFVEKIEKLLLRRASVVSTISEGMKIKLINKGIPEDKIFLLPNWVDTEYIKPLTKKDSLRCEFGFNENDKIILYSGNIGEKQGLEIVIDVAERFVKKRDIYFVFVGEGATKRHLINLANKKGLNNVKFYPLQPYEKLPKLLAMADIHLVIQKRAAADLVMPSKLTSILASGGLAIVTADKGTSLYNIIEKNKIAFTTEPEDADKLYEAIESCLENKSIKKIKENARKYAENYLNIDKIMESFDRLICDIN